MSRDIGPGATAARAAVGMALVVLGLLTDPSWWDVAAAVVLYPALAVLVAAGLARVLRSGVVRGGDGGWTGRETGASLLVGVVVVVAGVVLTFVSPVDGPSLYFFLGGSMLLAAAKGYAGCEVLALPNLLLGRRDAVWCVLFSPLDRAERGAAGQQAPGRR